MVNPPSNKENFQEIIQEADVRLQEIDPSPFSTPAFLKLKEKIDDYITQLIVESTNASKRHNSDTISVTDVERASEYLVSIS